MTEKKKKSLITLLLIFLIILVCILLGMFVGYVLCKSGSLEDAFWNKMKTENTIQSYNRYEGAYPQGKYIDSARINKRKILEQRDKSQKETTVETKESPKNNVVAEKKVVKKSPFRDEAELGIEWVLVEGGTFQMGCKDEECSDSEKPLHEVTVNSFYISKTELTQWQYKMVMKTNPSFNADCGDDCPVENVSWNDVQAFISKYADIYGVTVRLPYEAEWEYAARGGKHSSNYTFAGGNNIENIGWYWDNSLGKSKPVSALRPNELGLYDMSGNVSEWCYDWYMENYYSEQPMNNPTGPPGGNKRVMRGGSWNSIKEGCRSSFRGKYKPKNKSKLIGFRLVKDY